MKNMKKLFSLALALVMMMALVVTAGAAEPTGSITIDNASASATYKAYKIFDMTTSGSGDNATYSYTILGSSPFKTIVEAYKIDNVNVFKLTKIAGQTPDNFQVSINEGVTFDDAAAKTFVETLRDNTTVAGLQVDNVNVFAFNAAVTTGTGNDAKTTASTNNNLPYGYYYVDSNVGSLCVLDTLAPNVNISDKNNKPVVKKAEDSASTAGTQKIGDTVNFTITIDAKAGAENYVVYDRLGEGLTLSGNVTVKKNDTVVSEDDTTYDAEYATVDSTTGAITYLEYEKTGVNGKLKANIQVTFKEAFMNALVDTDTVTIEYSATINENAVSKPIGNTVDMSYGANEWTSDSTHGGDHNSEKNVGWIIIDKYAGVNGQPENKDNKLPDAHFQLLDVSGNVIKVKAITKQVPSAKDPNVTETEVYYIPDKTLETSEDIVTDSKGYAKIDGLGAGEYKLRETKAPDGYNLAKDDTPVTLTYDSATFTVSNKTESIVNNSGTELPETGGIGTTIFTVTGAVLMIGAAVLFLTKKRSEA